MGCGASYNATGRGDVPVAPGEGINSDRELTAVRAKREEAEKRVTELEARLAAEAEMRALLEQRVSSLEKALRSGGRLTEDESDRAARISALAAAPSSSAVTSTVTSPAGRSTTVTPVTSPAGAQGQPPSSSSAAKAKAKTPGLLPPQPPPHALQSGGTPDAPGASASAAPPASSSVAAGSTDVTSPNSAPLAPLPKISFHAPVATRRKKKFGGRKKDPANELTEADAVSVLEGTSYRPDDLPDDDEFNFSPRQARPSSSLEARAPLRQPGGPEERRLRARVREMRLKLGELHPQYLQAVARLASHLEVQGPGSATEAEMLYKEAASGATQWGAEGDFIALPVGAKLGRMYQAQGRLAESEDLFRSTLFGCRRLLGDRNADTLMCATKLARVLLQRGSNGEAEALYREAYEGRIALLGFANRDTVAAAARLARILRDRGAEGEARDIVQKVKAAIREAEELRKQEEEEEEYEDDYEEAAEDAAGAAGELEAAAAAAAAVGSGGAAAAAGGETERQQSQRSQHSSRGRRGSSGGEEEDGAGVAVPYGATPARGVGGGAGAEGGTPEVGKTPLGTPSWWRAGTLRFGNQAGAGDGDEESSSDDDIIDAVPPEALDESALRPVTPREDSDGEEEGGAAGSGRGSTAAAAAAAAAAIAAAAAAAPPAGGWAPGAPPTRSSFNKVPLPSVAERSTEGHAMSTILSGSLPGARAAAESVVAGEPLLRKQEEQQQQAGRVLGVMGKENWGSEAGLAPEDPDTPETKSELPRMSLSADDDEGSADGEVVDQQPRGGGGWPQAPVAPPPAAGLPPITPAARRPPSSGADGAGAEALFTTPGAALVAPMTAMKAAEGPEAPGTAGSTRSMKAGTPAQRRSKLALGNLNN